MPKRAHSFDGNYEPQLKAHISDLDVINNSKELKQQLGEKTFQKLFEAAKIVRPNVYQTPKQELDDNCYNCRANITDGIHCKVCPNYTCSSCSRSCSRCKEYSCWDCIRKAEIGYLCHLCVR